MYLIAVKEKVVENLKLVLIKPPYVLFVFPYLCAGCSWI